MEFYDLLNFEDEHIADVIVFDDGACVLKFNIYKGIYCFDDLDKLKEFLKELKLENYQLIHNGVYEDDEDSESESEDEED